MRQRRHAENAIAAPARQQRLALRDVDRDRTVRQLDALRAPRGAAGVLQRGQGVGLRRWRQGSVTDAPGIEPARAGADDQQMSHAGAARHRLRHRRQGRVHHEDDRGPVLEDRAQLVRGVQRVERHVLCARGQTGQRGDAGIDRIAEQCGDASAGAAERLQLVREGGDAGEVARIVQAALPAHQGLAVRRGLGGGAEHLHHGRLRLWQHRVCCAHAAPDRPR